MFIYKTTKYDRTTHIHIHVHKEKKNHKTKRKTDMKRITVKSISLCMCHNKKNIFFMFAYHIRLYIDMQNSQKRNRSNEYISFFCFINRKTEVGITKNHFCQSIETHFRKKTFAELYQEEVMCLKRNVK